jgi:hypothetical protein
MPDVVAPQSTAGPQPVAPQAPAEHHIAFHDILSALNPLQYVPVIGTIYRAVTGDQIPEPLRRIGTLVGSFLMGGPVGALINVAVTAAEKISGFDIDKTGQAIVVAAKPADQPVAISAPVPTTVPALPVLADFSAASAAPIAAQSAAPTTDPTSPWSPSQLAAYGVTTAADGTLKMAGLSGADVLNSLELARLHVAQLAYGRVADLAA